MTEIRLIYVTTRDASEARSIATELVRRKVVACANVLPQMESIYKWEGEIRFEQEAVLLLKTKESLVQETIRAIESLHSYETPCALSFAIEKGSEKYLNWLTAETN